MKTFFYHYNKPASQRKGKPQISVHFNKICHIVDNIICNVKCFGKINKRQPHFVMKGKCKDVKIVNNVAVIE